MISIPLIMANFNNPNQAPDFLPPIEIGKELQHEINKEHITFLTELYLKSKKNISVAQREWFLQEIGTSLQESFPELTRRDLINILQQIEIHGEER